MAHISIHEWAEADRPREKLIQSGRQALSDAELIAILLGSGTANASALDLARHVLQYARHNLNTLAQMDVKELCQVKGIGPAKAIALISAMELGRRRKEVEYEDKPLIKTADQAYRQLLPHMQDLNVEEFWVLYLNRANRVLAKERISMGGVTGTVADPKVIFQKALQHLAAGIILAHNHPSGNLVASDADQILTRKLVQAGKFLDIQILDHLIVTDQGYYSFADNGTLS
jgi:DNA repair protein RadC